MGACINICKMKPIALLSIVLFTALTLISCSAGFESKTYEAIKSAKIKFPNLVILDGKEYEVVRSLNISKPEARIQLFQPAKSPDRLQQILVISNSNNQFYAIPIPSIRFKSYWNFVYDTTPIQMHSATATFEAELNKALDILKLNNGYDGRIVLNEIFISVLQATSVNKTDSANLKINGYGTRTFPDTCLMVDEENYKSILKSAQSDSLVNFYIGSVFLNHQRIFDINYPALKQGKKTYYKIDVYRQPCVMDAVPIAID